MRAGMGDFLDILARDAARTIAEGYYEVTGEGVTSKRSLSEAIDGCNVNAVITEIKTASPSMGEIRVGIDAVEVATVMESSGATGISVLTEPKHFNGDLQAIQRIRGTVGIPVLMKDIVLDPGQLDAASRMGADAVLLIKALFNRDHCRCTLDEMIGEAHRLGLEVLLETHERSEFLAALSTGADLVGVNNRDLRTLDVDLGVTRKILEGYDPSERTVVAESGIKSPGDLRLLRDCGARAFLIGGAIMSSDDIGETVGRFVRA